MTLQHRRHQPFASAPASRTAQSFPSGPRSCPTATTLAIPRHRYICATITTHGWTAPTTTRLRPSRHATTAPPTTRSPAARLPPRAPSARAPSASARASTSATTQRTTTSSPCASSATATRTSSLSGASSSASSACSAGLPPGGPSPGGTQRRAAPVGTTSLAWAMRPSAGSEVQELELVQLCFCFAVPFFGVLFQYYYEIEYRG